MTVQFRMLDQGDVSIFDGISDDVFDNPVDKDLLQEFLGDPRHHICAALDRGQVIGFASGVHYVHPDKPPELWINEVGVASGHHRQGIGRALVEHLLDHGQTLGCVEAWVLTEPDNNAARALYRSAGGKESEPVVMASFRLAGTEQP